MDHHTPERHPVEDHTDVGGVSADQVGDVGLGRVLDDVVAIRATEFRRMM
jgi:hypothetical protein